MKIMRKPIEREINVEPLTKNSLKIRGNDYFYDELPNQVEEIFYICDDNGTLVGYIDMIFRTDRAFAVINRINQELLQLLWDAKQQEEILRKLISYLYGPNDLPYKLLVITCDQVGSNIDREVLERLGFLCRDTTLSVYCTSINPNFQQMISTTNDSETISTLTKWYQKYKEKQKAYHLQLLRDLELAYEVINSNEYGKIMNEAKKIEIQHIEAILGVQFGDKQLIDEHLNSRKLQISGNPDENN